VKSALAHAVNGTNYVRHLSEAEQLGRERAANFAIASISAKPINVANASDGNGKARYRFNDPTFLSVSARDRQITI